MNRAARLLLISDFTIDPLAELLKRGSADGVLEPVVMPYGQVAQTLLGMEKIASRDDRCSALVWTRAESAIPSFERVLRFEPTSLAQLLQEVDEFADLLIGAAAFADLLVVPTWTVRSDQRGLGPLSWKSETGLANCLARINVRLSERLAPTRNVLLLDAERWVANVGRRASSPKLWHMAKMSFGLEVLEEAARDILAAIEAARGRSAKAIILDLDDTLWPGIVGEVGWEALRLGGHDPIGEAFVAFQRSLKALSRTGVILGLVSKNDEETAFAAIDNHPEMVLRRSDFAGWRVNWNDKAANIVSLVDELNIGLDSVVFIDDNPVERARVREALPAIRVPEWPADPMLYEHALATLTWFDRIALTTEDASRTEMYVVDQRRRAQRDEAVSLDEWLASLQLTVSVSPLTAANLARVVQLMNKTNQMNLATRRVTEQSLSEWTEVSGNRVFAFSVADRFGEYGLTGVAGLELSSEPARISDYLLSCRVMGRGLEEAMLSFLIQAAAAKGAQSISASLVPTKRNNPCLEFFSERSGMTSGLNTHEFSWSTDRPYPMPTHVRFERTGDFD
jgi:FkbH-like protein